MPDDKTQPDLQDYKLAWLLWFFVLAIPVILLVALLYIVNMFARVFPTYVVFYGVGVGLTLFLFALMAIAWMGLHRRVRGLPAWEPWPVGLFAVKLQGLAKHID